MPFERSFINKIKTSVAAGLTALTASAAAGEAFAEQHNKPKEHRFETEIEAPLPTIKYSPRKDGVILNYKNRNTIGGGINADIPEIGLLEYTDRIQHESQRGLLRAADHELCHQQYDQLPVKQKQEVVAALKDDLPEMLRLMSDYQDAYAQKSKINQDFADSFMVNELVAHVMSYVDVPLGPTPTIKEIAPKKWNEMVINAAKTGMTEAQVVEFVATNPDILMQHINDSDRYDSSEIIGYEFQLLAPKIYFHVQAIARKYGIGNNTKRAQRVIETINAQQMDLQKKQEQIRHCLEK